MPKLQGLIGEISGIFLKSVFAISDNYQKQRNRDAAGFSGNRAGFQSNHGNASSLVFPMLPGCSLAQPAVSFRARSQS
jgi:hypothetical protein